MCGIGGLITNYNFTQTEANICRDLLTSLVRRGQDAWGFFDGEYVYKEPGNFAESEYYYKLPEILIGKRIFLGHTRLATRGDPKDNKNNHPFVLRPFVFAHNGVIFYSDKFRNEWEIDTDSFWLLYWIWREYQDVQDTVEAIRMGVSHVRGGYACWLYSFDDKATYLFRNHYYPAITLYYEIEDGNGVLFGSDVRSIYDAIGFKEKLKEVKSGVIYRIDNGFIEEVGRFRYNPMKRLEEIRFNLIYGHLWKYDLESLEVVENDS